MGVEDVLTNIFELKSFRKGQKEVIDALLRNESAAAIFPTGSGKSLCYQLPAQCLDGLTIVISPLIALMKDQIDSLSKKNIAASRLDSSLSEDDYKEVFRKIRNQELKLLYIAPERLGNERFLAQIKGVSIAMLAVDEAHCISSWGHNFRPEYLKIAKIAQVLNIKRILALTATATPAVIEDMSNAFSIPKTNIINTGFYRKNLELRVQSCSQTSRITDLIKALKNQGSGSTIVYVTLQKTAEEVAARLMEVGFNASAYHAGMKSEERSRIQDQFMSSNIEIVVATIAFGMGVDKSNIRAIYHYNMPKGFESYMQEIGRAGRDGSKSVCTWLVCPEDRIILENFTYGDTPEKEKLGELIDELLNGGEEIDVSIYDLSRRFDIRNLVINTLLTRLELVDVLQSMGSYYGQIQFKPNRSSQEMVSNLTTEKKQYLLGLFSCASKARTWFSLDSTLAIKKLKTNRDRILAAMDWCARQGYIELKLTGFRHLYRKLPQTISRDELHARMYKEFEQHEDREIKRIHGMLDFAQNQNCLTQHLLRYFGEQIGRCGHCGSCMGQELESISDLSVIAAVPNQVISGIKELAKKYPEALSSKRQMARFLCGIRSPATSAAKLGGHPLFESCLHIPFGDVMEAL